MLLTSRDIHYIYDWGGCRGEPVCGPAMAGMTCRCVQDRLVSARV